MDEILASIRRIIADDEPLPRRASERVPEMPSRRPPPAEPVRLAGQTSVRENAYAPTSYVASPAGEAADPMESEEMPDYPYQGPTPGQPAPRRPEPVREQGAPARPASMRAPEPLRPQGEVRHQGENGRRKELLSPDVDAAVSAAFESLGDAVLPAHERTVEDLVKEILRPMLKTWLDDNLPRIVERLVRQEIERVSRASR